MPWRGAKEDHIVKVSGFWDDDGMTDGTSFATFQLLSIHWLAAQFMKSILGWVGVLAATWVRI